MITTINEFRKFNEDASLAAVNTNATPAPFKSKTVPEVGKFYKAFDSAKNGALAYSSIELKSVADGTYHFIATNKTDNVIDIPIENTLSFIEIKNPITAKIN